MMKKVFIGIIILSIGFLVYLVFGSFLDKSSDAEPPQKLVLEIDGTKDWVSFYDNNRNDVPVYDIDFPLKEVGVRVRERLSPVALVDDMVFLIDILGKEIWFGAFDRELSEWKYRELVDKRRRKCFNPHLVLRDNRVYFTVTGITRYKEGEDIYDRNVYSYIYCYNIEDKEVVWDKEIVWRYEDLTNQWDTNLLVYGDKVVVWLADKESGDKIYCYDAETGKELWANGDLQWRIVDSEGAASNDKFYILGSKRASEHNSEIIALDINTGETVWHKDTIGINEHASIVVIDNKIHFGTSDILYTMDADTGEIESKVLRDDEKVPIIYPTIILHNNNNFYTTIEDGIMCYNNNGDIKWIKRNLWSPKLCFLTKTHLYAINNNTELLALNTQTGIIDYSLPLTQNIKKHPITQAAVRENTLYLTTKSGNIFAYES